MAAVYDYVVDESLPPQVTGRLLDALDSDIEAVRAVATFTLAFQNTPPIVERLIGLALLEESDLIRELAVWALGLCGARMPRDSRITNTLLQCTKDPALNVRLHAICSLKHHRGGRVVDAARIALGEAPIVAKAGLEQLGKQRDEGALDLLIDYVEGRVGLHQRELLKFAITEVGKHRSRRVEDVLLKLLGGRRQRRVLKGKAVELAAVALHELVRHATERSREVLESFTSVPGEVRVQLGLHGDSWTWHIRPREEAKRALARLSRRKRVSARAAHLK